MSARMLTMDLAATEGTFEVIEFAPGRTLVTKIDGVEPTAVRCNGKTRSPTRC